MPLVKLGDVSKAFRNGALPTGRYVVESDGILRGTNGLVVDVDACKVTAAGSLLLPKKKGRKKITSKIG